MTIYQFINKYEEKHPGNSFFHQEELKFFGEALSRMRVLKRKKVVTDSLGEERTCIVVSATRHKDWSGPCKPYTYHHYFDAETLERI